MKSGKILHKEILCTHRL